MKKPDRLEDLGRIRSLLEALLEREYFDISISPKQYCELLDKMPKTNRDRSIGFLVYGQEEIKAELYKILQIAACREE